MFTWSLSWRILRKVRASWELVNEVSYCKKQQDQRVTYSYNTCMHNLHCYTFRSILCIHTTYCWWHVLAIGWQSTSTGTAHCSVVPTLKSWCFGELYQPFLFQSLSDVLLCLNENRSAWTGWQTTSVHTTTSWHYLHTQGRKGWAILVSFRSQNNYYWLHFLAFGTFNFAEIWPIKLWYKHTVNRMAYGYWFC